jgi:hypothetical protein
MSVIPVGPVHDHTDEVRKTGAFDNKGQGVGEWFVAEAVWFVGMFVRVAASVAFSRYVYSKIFDSKVVPRAAFDRAHDIMRAGRRDRPYRMPPGSGPAPGYGAPSGGSAAPSGTTSSAASGNGSGDPSSYAPAPQFDSHGTDKGRIVKQVGEYILVHHDTRLREDHFWPCPIQNRREACLDCAFFVVRSREATCAAVEKLRQLLAGQDDGSDLYELAERLRKG